MNQKNYNPQGDVASFMKACGQDVPSEPTMPDRKTLLLRAKLIYEEATEFVVAAGCFIGMNDDGELTVFEDDETEPNMVEMYDAIVDINYVSYGASCTLGLPVQPGHDEVHRSNLTKVSPDGTVKKNEFGKIVKPHTFSKANLKTVVEKLGYKHS